jgi:hypothetical protein
MQTTRLARAVLADILDLLASDSVTDTVVLFHDSMNEGVRKAITDPRVAAHSKVAYVNSSFLEVPPDKPPFTETWSGFGLIVVSEDVPSRAFSHPDVRGFWEIPVPRTLLWRAGAPVRRLKRRLRFEQLVERLGIR